MNRVYSATGQFPARQIKEGCMFMSDGYVCQATYALLSLSGVIHG